jgi:hypothetical protein
MMTEPEEFTRSAAIAEFGRTEPQRLSSPILGWESVQSRAKVPAGVAPGATATRVSNSIATSCEAT